MTLISPLNLVKKSMQNTSLANVCARHAWLLRAAKAKGRLAPECLTALTSARQFCDFEIPGKFAKISLNTFKEVAKRGLIPGIYAPAYATQWEYLLNLLSEARDHAQSPTKHSSETIVEISSDEKIKQANLHAHLCSLAFVNLFNSIESILESQDDLSDIAKARLQRQIDISREKFKHISSPSSLKNSRLDLVKD